MARVRHLRHAGAPVPRRRRATTEVPAALRDLGVTSREAETLALVAGAQSNAEIAERLYVSTRTVESHRDRPPNLKPQQQSDP